MLKFLLIVFGVLAGCALFDMGRVMYEDYKEQQNVIKEQE